MHLLLDTHALLWWLLGDPSLSANARRAIRSEANQSWVSAASAWEIATKVRLGKLPSAAGISANFSMYTSREGFSVLDITAAHALRAGSLAGAHKDPFDRILIAQAQAENLAIVSANPIFDRYGVVRVW